MLEPTTRTNGACNPTQMFFGIRGVYLFLRCRPRLLVLESATVYRRPAAAHSWQRSCGFDCIAQREGDVPGIGPWRKNNESGMDGSARDVLGAPARSGGGWGTVRDHREYRRCRAGCDWRRAAWRHRRGVEPGADRKGANRRD